MVAGLQVHVERGPLQVDSHAPRLLNGRALGMCSPIACVVPLGQQLPLTHQHGPHHGVRGHGPHALLRKLQGAAHVLRIQAFAIHLITLCLILRQI